MANVSIFDIVGQKRPKKAKKKKAKKKSKKKKSEKLSEGWGTPVERYRRLCLHAQLCRFAYYVKSTSIIPDKLYDKLEHVILKIEDKNRVIIEHKYSPSGRPGSDQPGDYPRSVQHTWNFTLRHHDSFEAVASVIEDSMRTTLEAFDMKV